MQYVCDAPPKTWFRIETEGEAKPTQPQRRDPNDRHRRHHVHARVPVRPHHRGWWFGSLEIYHRTVNTRTRAQEPYTAIHTAAIPEEAWDDEKVMLAFIRDHVMHVVTHEVDEWLRYDDELIHDPHK